MSARVTHRVRGGVADAAARAVIGRARQHLDVLLDEVRRDLVAVAGRSPLTMKSDGSPVTPYDRATDERLIGGLLDVFPTHGAVSEEQHRTAPDTSWTWILDPIDGTSNFIAGLPYWCVSIALCLDGSPVFGVVEAPTLARRFVAIAGQGAFEVQGSREERLRVAPAVGLHDPGMAHVPGLYSGGAARDLTADGVRLNARVMGASALDLALVARGVAPIAVQLGPHVWDIAAGALLVEEAGGVVIGTGDTPLLPLTPGREYGDAVVRTAAASTEAGASDALAAVDRGRAVRRQA